MITNPHMLPKVRSEKLRDACADMPCTLRIGTFIGLPCWAQDTVCGDHLPIFGKGTSTKVTDLAIAAGCFLCHDLLDDRNEKGRIIREKYPLAYGMQLLKACLETQSRWVEMGLLSASTDQAAEMEIALKKIRKARTLSQAQIEAYRILETLH